MKLYTFFSVLLLLNLSCAQNKTKPITEISQNDIKNGILVDVRTPEEFNAGHLDDAVNINWFDTDFNEQFETIDKDKVVYMYCRTGNRSAKAQEKLQSMGYKHVVNLEGGYEAWKLK